MADLMLYRAAKGAGVGVLVAARTDYHAFRAWKTWEEAAAYNWKVAGWRWFQGAVIGALTTLGLGAL